MVSQPNIDEIIQVAQIWKHNRSVYPGWLVAPDSICGRLEFNTGHWIGHYVQQRLTLSLAHELDILFELNWRLETALAPIFSNLIPAYKHVLSSINPFPEDIADLPNAVGELRDPDGREVEASVIRTQWLALALALLRYHREEREHDQFETLSARIGRIKQLDPDSKARLCYEHALFYLAEMDDPKVLQAIEQWPDNTNDRFWSVRKASLLGELAQTERASITAQSALSMFRRGLSGRSEDIPQLSREGWTMWLIMALQQDIAWRNREIAGLEERARFRARFRKLEAFGCSPLETMESLQELLKRDPPKPGGLVEERPGFEPGTSSRTIHFGNRFAEQLLPAYKYFRLVEESAYVPGFPHLTMSADSLRRVALWLAEFDPVRTQGLMIRLADEKLAESYLSRHRVAALQPHVLARFRTIAQRGVEQALAAYRGTPSPPSQDQSLAWKRLEFSMELLGRGSARETGATLGNTWELAMKLYGHAAVYTNVAFQSPMRALFRALVTATPLSGLSQRLPQAFKLPVPGEPGFPTPMPESWADPALLLAFKVQPGSVDRENANWSEITRHLFDLLATDSPETRRNAMWRLVKLNDLEILSDDIAQRLSAIFWSTSNDSPSLPFGVWGVPTPSWALSIPSPPRASASQKVKAYILSSQIGQIHSGVVSPSLLALVNFGTRLDPAHKKPKSRHFISWTQADLPRLFQIIDTWWSQRGRNQARELQHSIWRQAFERDAIHDLVSEVCDILRLVIIPRLRRGDALVPRIFQLIADMKESQLPTGAVAPAKLLLDPAALPEVTSELRRELANPTVQGYLSALRGVVFWVAGSAPKSRPFKPRMPPIPVDLIREVSRARYSRMLCSS